MVEELPFDLFPINVIYQTSRLGPNRLEVLKGPQKDQGPHETQSPYWIALPAPSCSRT